MQWNWITVLGILSYLIGVLGLFFIPANRKPGEATAWLLLFFLAPVLGAILFLLLGNPKLSSWRREQQQHMNEHIKEFVEEAGQTPAQLRLWIRRSRPLSLDAWQARLLHTKLFDNLARLTSALQ